MKTMSYVLAGMLALTTLQASAQETGLVVATGLLGAQGNASTLTRQVWGGHTFETGYIFAPKDYGIGIMPHIGWGRMPGKKDLADRSQASYWGPNSYDLLHWRVGIDFRVTPSDRLPLVIAFGPVFHTWQVERIGVKEKPLGDQSMKMGWRLGVEYPVSAQWSVCASYTQSEWRSQRDVSKWPGYVSDAATPSFIDGLNPSKPAYLSLMGRYRF